MTQTNTQTANSTKSDLTDEIDIDVRGLLLMLWRRKMIIIACILIGMSFTLIVTSLIKSEYTARALVLIETGSNQKVLNQVQSAVSRLRLDTSLILSEIEVLKSRSLAEKVVKRLNLLSDPEFNPRFSYKDEQRELETGQSFRKLTVYGSELEKLPSEVIDRDVGRVITAFLGNLAVRSVAGSNAIQVDFTSTDPSKAALIANTVVDIYIEQQLERKFIAAKKVTDWLDKRLTDLREQVRAAEKSVAEYKEQHNITEGARRVTMSTEQLSALNAQLVVARSKKAEAQARLDQVTDLSKNPGKIETTSEIVNSRLIQGLKQELVRLEGTMSDLSTRYGKKHPKILELKSEIKGLRGKIGSEMLKIAKSVENEVLFADARIQELEKGLAEYQGQQHEDNDAMIALRELEREAQSTRLIYDTFLETYKRSDEQEELAEAEAKVLSYAVTPLKPSYPNKMLLISLSATISLFIGLALAIMMEKLDNTFRSANQLEKSMGYPCYALVPHVENQSQAELTNYIISKPSSTVAESVRTLRTVLKLRSNTEEKPRCVTITSSFPGEGKTTLSIWLARLAAKSGEKVILIDADLRRPNIHRSFRRSNETSLVDYLTGNKELEDVVQKDEASGAHIVYGRSVPNSALDLVSSEKMEKLVESLKQVYDLVIIDSPACLAVSDARILASMSDQLVYTVGWDETPREVVMSGVKQFADISYENIAFVLSNVDVKRHAKYGYGDSAYYYGRYQEYYKN